MSEKFMLFWFGLSVKALMNGHTDQNHALKKQNRDAQIKAFGPPVV